MNGDSYRLAQSRAKVRPNGLNRLRVQHAGKHRSGYALPALACVPAVLAGFCAAQWPGFTPPLTSRRPSTTSPPILTVAPPSAAPGPAGSTGAEGRPRVPQPTYGSQSTAAGRRGYFLAGVGLTTGHALDAIAADANLLLIQANGAILEGDTEGAITAIAGLAERVFAFYPFTPDPLPANWRDILRAWLLGQLARGAGRSAGL